MLYILWVTLLLFNLTLLEPKTLFLSPLYIKLGLMLAVFKGVAKRWLYFKYLTSKSQDFWKHKKKKAFLSILTYETLWQMNFKT